MTKNVILVTGASAGIGRACADALSTNGWTVIGASRRGVSGSSWRGVEMDVDDDESVTSCVNRITVEHGQLDAVLACAGWGLAGAAEHTPIADAKAQFETNFWGCVRVVHAALPIMRTHGGGRIVLMSSIGGVIGIPYQSFYSASKFALEGYAESLAYEVEPFNVKVTLVEPGNFKTDFTSSRRLVTAPETDPYATASTKAIEVMERDELSGANPLDVASTVLKVLSASRPARRVSVGKFDERIGVVAKRLMPFKLFEASARSSLGVSKKA